MNRLWILGAADPEMERIEALLRECGECIVYASRDESGRRVRAAEAYEPYLSMIEPPGGTTWRGSSEPVVYCVECAAPAGFTAVDDVRVIDHHRPGDPGYGRPPSEFMTASSIGQVVLELNRFGQLTSSWRLPRSA